MRKINLISIVIALVVLGSCRSGKEGVVFPTVKDQTEQTADENGNAQGQSGQNAGNPATANIGGQEGTEKQVQVVAEPTTEEILAAQEAAREEARRAARERRLAKERSDQAREAARKLEQEREQERLAKKAEEEKLAAIKAEQEKLMAEVATAMDAVKEAEVQLAVAQNTKETPSFEVQGVKGIGDGAGAETTNAEAGIKATKKNASEAAKNAEKAEAESAKNVETFKNTIQTKQALSEKLAAAQTSAEAASEQLAAKAAEPNADEAIKAAAEQAKTNVEKIAELKAQNDASIKESKAQLATETETAEKAAEDAQAELAVKLEEAQTAVAKAQKADVATADAPKNDALSFAAQTAQKETIIETTKVIKETIETRKTVIETQQTLAEKVAIAQAVAEIEGNQVEAKRLEATKAALDKSIAQHRAQLDSEYAYLEKLYTELAANQRRADLRFEAIKKAYLQVRGAVNYTATEGSRERQSLGDPTQLGGEGQLIFGSEFSPVWGWRAGIGYCFSREIDINKLPDLVPIPFHSIELFAGLTIDWLDISYQYRRNRNWDFYGYLDLGYFLTLPRPNIEIPAETIYCYAKNCTHNFGIRAGLHVARKITKKCALGIDAAILGVGDSYSGVAVGIPFDLRASIGVGFTWTIGKD